MPVSLDKDVDRLPVKTRTSSQKRELAHIISGNRSTHLPVSLDKDVERSPVIPGNENSEQVHSI